MALLGAISVGPETGADDGNWFRIAKSLFAVLVPASSPSPEISFRASSSFFACPSPSSSSTSSNFATSSGLISFTAGAAFLGDDLFGVESDLAAAVVWAEGFVTLFADGPKERGFWVREEAWVDFRRVGGMVALRFSGVMLFWQLYEELGDMR